MPATSRGKIYNSLQLGNFFHLFSHKGLWSGSETTVFQKPADWPLISRFLQRKTRAPSLCSLNNASELAGRFRILRKLRVSVSSHAHTRSQKLAIAVALPYVSTKNKNIMHGKKRRFFWGEIGLNVSQRKLI